MDNPLSRLAPQLFGEYPKPFINLVENISLGPVSYTHLRAHET